ncbi:anti-phage deoxyguanosine triphosphatase [Paracoccus siganidrum]|uniref:Deoxyguanosinetriphosphate triphosphohydrolase-like protein n=1 Tax=Paracoccus siganidrum TaxID=1276757 RepID=A0A418ZVY8_9RHOB|nr:anti-phage deoxyguanosine triphosphatase [Paracoccus siganidrum]RJL03973.1 dNTP triphosphohydrolase [Paracoccus siganidrum]RMC34005.1 dGTPase [Paracoccus siganidrum]
MQADPAAWLERREGWRRQDADARDEGDVDFGRVIHSASFRRLQGKTQILNLGDSDFYRTRLTHSLEVAQIAGGLVQRLRRAFPDHPAAAALPDRAMIQAIALTHDLGHPPFGHGGEVALNYCMRDRDGCQPGGFEGNGQTLRILSRLENFSANAGANLTRRSLLGVLKYPLAFSAARNPAISPRLHRGLSTLQTIDVAASTPPKCYLDSESDVVDWILAPLSPADRDAFQDSREGAEGHRKPLHKSLDCSLMDLADDIAYGVHDLEDAIALRLVTPEQFREEVTPDRCSSFVAALRRDYPGESNDPHASMVAALFGEAGSRKRHISRMVGHLITAVEFSQAPQFADPLLRWRAALPAPQAAFLAALKDFVFRRLIRSPGVQQLEFKGQRMVVALFEALESDPERLLPDEARDRLGRGEDALRVICDTLAAMTDAHLLRSYERLFAPRMGSVFDRL